MAVEILTVSLSDDSVERLAQRVAQLMDTAGSPTPTAQSQGPAQSAPQADPWTGPEPSDIGQWPQGGQQQAAPQQSYQAPQQQQYPQAQQGNGPTCNHGPMRYVPAGFSQSSGKAYGAFWGCTAPRGAPDKCKSVQAR